jgi:uncharacterized phage protein gp47/JayE
LPYPRPTLTTLRTQVLQDINAAQITDKNGNVLIALLQKAVLRVLANATAGMSYEHYGFIDWISLQAIPWTATDEFLEGWANLKGVFREIATATQGTATFPGTNGEDVPAGTSVSRSDGVAFISTADATVSGNSVTIDITATTPGSAGNFDPNTQFNFTTPISGVIGASTASVQTVAGTDTELDDSLRTRMLAVYAAPPQGGDRADYIEWSRAVPGVTRSWINPSGNGPGTVTMYVMFDLVEAAFGGFPQGTNGVAANETRDTAATGDQLVVANALFPDQPVTALVYVCAPNNQPTNFTIADLGANNTAAMQASITAALVGMFLQFGNVGGSVNPATGDAWPSIPPNAWYSALEAISGLSQFEVSSPAVPIVAATGSLPTLGTITFSS